MKGKKGWQLIMDSSDSYLRWCTTQIHAFSYIQLRLAWPKQPKNQGDFYKLLTKLLPKNPTITIGVQLDLSDRLKQARKRIE